MFSKKEEPPTLVIFELEYNCSAIMEWTKNKGKIPPDPKWDYYDVTRKHKITLLPVENLLFYHKDTNDFTTTIGGVVTLSRSKYLDLEWGWNKYFFYAIISEEDENEEAKDLKSEHIFLAPSEEIVYFFDHLKPKLTSGNSMKEMKGGIVELANYDSDGFYKDVFCSQIHKAAMDGLIYSNSLFKLTVYCDKGQGCVPYPDA